MLAKLMSKQMPGTVTLHLSVRNRVATVRDKSGNMNNHNNNKNFIIIIAALFTIFQKYSKIVIY